MQIPPFNELIGTTVSRRGNGEAEVSLELLPHHLNLRGVAHGGVMTSLLDSALGAAVISSMPSEWWCATLSLNTEFLRGPVDGRLTARGRVVRRGRSIAFAAGEVVDDRDRLLATGTGTWRLWSGKPGTKTAPPDTIQIEDTGERLRVGKILAIG
ncbi:MAG: PaaI family thioesterase, partial [Acidobacteriota bacterium]|nr:PaaI family thioesterase [Acidobacteriota bacterium]